MGVHVDTIYTRNQYYGIRLVVMLDHRHDIPGQVVDESPVAELDLMLTSDAYPYREEHEPVDDISRLPTLELSPSAVAHAVRFLGVCNTA